MDIKSTIETVKGFPKEIAEIAKELDKAQKLMILGHKNPDMDCIGSQVSLALAMRERGKEVIIYSNGPFHSYMKDYEKLYTNKVENIDDIDLFIVVDTSSLNRIDVDFELPLEKVIVLDHHVTNENFGKVNYIDSDLISATEIIFMLLVFMDYSFDRNKTVVQILLDGILSDNGYYKHIRTDKYMSLIFTYLLISKGANPKETYDKMYVNNSIDEIKLLGKILNRIDSLKNNQIIYTYQTDNDENGTVHVSSALLFQQMTSIKTGKIFVYFKINTAENKVIISMRCSPEYDVGSIANSFGGGGHKVAAGATIPGDYETVRKKVLNKILEVYFS